MEQIKKREIKTRLDRFSSTSAQPLPMIGSFRGSADTVLCYDWLAMKQTRNQSKMSLGICLSG